MRIVPRPHLEPRWATPPRRWTTASCRCSSRSPPPASLAAAVVDRGISYRAAWGLLRDYQRKLGVPLVLLERGRGASLTSAGEQSGRGAHGRHPAARANTAETLRRDWPAAAAGARRVHCCGFASPPVTIWRWRRSPSSCPTTRGSPRTSRSWAACMRSGNSSRVVRTSRASTCRSPAARRWTRKPFLKWLRARRDRLVRFVDRDQGLILPRGNPAQVKHFRDIATKGQRFVNRQRGSGTRLLIDQTDCRRQHRFLGRDRRLSDRGIHPCSSGGDRCIGRCRRGLRLARRRRRIPTRLCPAGARALLSRDPRQGSGNRRRSLA